MFFPSSNENENLPSGTFTHQRFTPKRHIPPFNYNAKCDLSPVITNFFIELKFIQNPQSLDHIMVYQHMYVNI